MRTKINANADPDEKQKLMDQLNSIEKNLASEM